MEIFLIRHSEATKNLRDSAFSSITDEEELTERGRHDAGLLAATFARVRATQGATVVSSGNRRARELALMIAAATKGLAETDARLAPQRAGKLAGKTEAEVAECDPDYFRSLTLYRRGVLGAYDIPHRGEPVREFEARVVAALTRWENMDRPPSTLIVCGHRSCITAALMFYARRYHGWPLEHYGYIDLPLLSVSRVRIDSDGIGEIKYVAESWALINDG